MFLISFLFLSPLSVSWSQEGGEGSPSLDSLDKIELFLGQKKTISIYGMAPFAADETVLEVEEITPGRVTLTGLRGGMTQMLFWRAGVIQAVIVEIVVPQIRTSPGLGPRFRGNRSHFLYEFQNNSTFDKERFFQSPSYGHSMAGQTPITGGRRLRSQVRFQHQGDEKGSIPGAGLVFEGRQTKAFLGDTNVSLSRILSEASGSSPYGSSLQIRTPAGSYEQELNLFGGIKKPVDLMEIEVEDQAYGANYSLTRHQRGNLSPDLANVSLFAYQPPGTETFKPGGIVELNHHFSPPFSLGGGVAQEKGGVAATASSLYEKERSFTSTRYLYLNPGLQPIGGAPLQNDHHRSQFSHQQFLKNKVTLIRTGLSHNLSLARGTAASPTSHLWSGLMELRHQTSPRTAYGAQYQSGATLIERELSLKNGLSGNFAHPLSQAMTMRHSVGYSRLDLTDRAQQVNASSVLSVETGRFIADTVLTGGVSWGDPTKESASLDQNFQTSLGRADLRVGVSYRKADLRDNLHQVQLSPSLFLPITTTHWLGLGGSGALTQGGSQGIRISGSAGVQYRHYFGPGIERDPAWRRLIGRREKGPVEGRLFLDDNYNNYFEETDRPLPNVPIRLDSREGKFGKEVKTGPDGQYLFPNVKTGEHTLFVDRKLLGLNETVAKIPLRSFTTEGKGVTTILIPVHVPKAALRVRLVLDNNNNGEADLEDGITNIRSVIVKGINDPNEKRIPVHTGEGRLPGFDTGQWKVSLDPMEIPEDMELISPMEQSVSVTRIAEYTVTFLFSPIRSLRGRVQSAAGKKLPPRLEIFAGPSSSTVDSEGFYWIKDMTPGSHTIEIKNLPSSLCLTETSPVEVPSGGAFVEARNLTVSKCAGL